MHQRAVSCYLDDGEQVVAISKAKRPHGLAPLPPYIPPPKTDPHAGAKLVAFFAAALAINPLSVVESIIDSIGGGPGNWLDRLLFGRAVAGPLGSIAGGYAVAVPNDEVLLVVVTDRRLFIFKRPSRLEPLWWAMMDDIAEARARWHRLHGARVRIGFQDESWLELTGPLCMGWRRAGELCDALNRQCGGQAQAQRPKKDPWR